MTPSSPLGKFGPKFGSDEPLGEEAARDGRKGFGNRGYAQRGAGRFGLQNHSPGLQSLVDSHSSWAVSSNLTANLVCITDPDYAPFESVWNPTTRDGLVTWVGFIGTSLSIILYVSSKNFLRDDTEATIGDKLNSLDETLVRSFGDSVRDILGIDCLPRLRTRNDSFWN